MPPSSESSSERKILDCLNLKMKSLKSFGMSETSSQATQCHIPKDIDIVLRNLAEPQNLRHQSSCVLSVFVAHVQH